MNYPLYNKTLCPKLWGKQGETWVMKKEIRDRLLQIVQDFLKEKFEESEIKVKPKDIVLVGSSTNYNWTQYSDLDIHVIVDLKDFSMSEEEARAMLDAIRNSWNKAHNITIKGHKLEISFELVGDENSVTSIYSILNNKWVTPPKFERPTFNKEVIKKKHKELKAKIDATLKSQDEEQLRDVLDKLYVFRQAGLDRAGEFSEENIVFKILRAQGYVDKLKKYTTELYDKEMTLAEIAAKTPIHGDIYQLQLGMISAKILAFVEENGRWPNSFQKIVNAIANQHGIDSDAVQNDLMTMMEKFRQNSDEEF